MIVSTSSTSHNLPFSTGVEAPLGAAPFGDGAGEEDAGVFLPFFFGILPLGEGGAVIVAILEDKTVVQNV